MKPKTYFDDPAIESQEFKEQPDSDEVANPPTHLTIRGERFEFVGWTVHSGINGNNDGEIFYCVKTYDGILCYVSNFRSGRFAYAMVPLDKGGVLNALMNDVTLPRQALAVTKGENEQT
jgi:hypothetical protein